MAASFELFDLFREHLPEEVARELAVRLGTLDQLATKADLDEFRNEMKAEFKAEIHRVETMLQSMETSIYKWMLTFNATLFLEIAGMIVAIVLKG